MAAMLKLIVLQLSIAWIIVSASAVDNEFSNCNCDDDGFWSLNRILECQKVSDFLIAIAYFSIPIELLYFLSCSNVPFKWVLLQFVAFIVLCGLTHLLNGWTYYGPHSFQLMLALTVAKILTALVSCATAITLLTLIPLLLKIKVRELFLRQNVLELDQEVGMMMKQKEASMHVRMLTQEIRKSLDKDTILYTTLVELSKTLDLQNCAVWMLNENGMEMDLTYQLSAISREHHRVPMCSISINDPDVLEIIKNEGVRFLRQESVLGAASCDGGTETGAVAAIRMPMLRASNFKGGTPEFVDPRYAILVLVIPSTSDRVWSINEMQIVEVVADQVAVALSHAAVLEESQSMREKLEEQNRVLQQAKMNAMMANQARDAFQRVMSNGMRRPLHSILGLLALFQDENKSFKQGIIVDTVLKTSNVLSTLINDAVEISAKDDGRFPLEMRPFRLHSMIREASCLVKCLCVYKGFDFSTDLPNTLPNEVIGDERRTFQVLLHMVGHLLNTSDGKGSVIFRAVEDGGIEGRNDNLWAGKRPSTNDEYIDMKFEVEVNVESFWLESSTSTNYLTGRRKNNKEIKQGLGFSMCKKLVQMMQGNIWMSSNSEGRVHSMSFILRFQKQSSFRRHMFEVGNSEQQISNSKLRGLRVILVDDDDINRMVTKRLLEKLGCQVTTVSSGFECLSALGQSATSFQVVILDLQMPEMDGFEVALRIRKFRSRNWPLIIALTASAEDRILEKCLQAGMNGLIRKPVLLQGMADEIRRVLQRSGEGL
ncbi:protein EIN4-like isoform X2 [Olea europaea var. sylvestris]|uniref:protein EIN4-like isoform X2 n=1 Tax=Olea europaea var. sylvestris TaxID=158386 RepID=UPI000C1CCC4A|nr:protein EIN4-like isoform X2 [Olea europaea var. sylvestris]